MKKGLAKREMPMCRHHNSYNVYGVRNVNNAHRHCVCESSLCLYVCFLLFFVYFCYHFLVSSCSLLLVRPCLVSFRASTHAPSIAICLWFSFYLTCISIEHRSLLVLFSGHIFVCWILSLCLKLWGLINSKKVDKGLLNGLNKFAVMDESPIEHVYIKQLRLSKRKQWISGCNHRQTPQLSVTTYCNESSVFHARTQRFERANLHEGYAILHKKVWIPM